MKKRPIPPIPASVDRDLRAFLDPLKENVEVISGFRGGQIKPLTGSPSIEQIVAKINEIVARMN